MTLDYVDVFAECMKLKYFSQIIGAQMHYEPTVQIIGGGSGPAAHWSLRLWTLSDKLRACWSVTERRNELNRQIILQEDIMNKGSVARMVSLQKIRLLGQCPVPM